MPVDFVARTIDHTAAAIEARTDLDGVLAPVREHARTILSRIRVKDLLHGTWLGHPLHPVLVDLPIGFWTTSFALDLFGGRAGRRFARESIALGVLSAPLAASAGVADWSETDGRDARVGAVHGALNLLATVAYTASWRRRRRQDDTVPFRVGAIAWSTVGMALATGSAALGGHLMTRRGVGIDRNADIELPSEWTDLHFETAPSAHGKKAKDVPTTFTLEGVDYFVPDAAEPRAMAVRCSHRGGPLNEGTTVDDCVECPWHGSRFRVADGHVVRGPATAPQPMLEVNFDADPPAARALTANPGPDFDLGFVVDAAAGVVVGEPVATRPE